MGAAGQSKLGTLGLNWVYTAGLRGRYSNQVSLQMILFLEEFADDCAFCCCQKLIKISLLLVLCV